MTLIAGIFNRKGRPVADSTCDALRESISRNPQESISVFKDQRSYFVKADIGAFGESGAFVDANGALSLLTGEPLLNLHEDGSWQGRNLDLGLIHAGCANDPSDVLRKAEGTFAAVHYDSHSGALSLIADKLGLRPLYYWTNKNMVVFASALRILEHLVEVPRKMDLRAVTEIAALGMPLGNRTPYANIFLLKPAEIVRITESRISHTQYWRWDEIGPSTEAERDRLREVHDRFQLAVVRRNRNDLTTVAYLSGGLDSRCIVGALAGQRVRVHTFNFARPGTQDEMFGNEFAREMQTIHTSNPKERGDSVPDYSSMMSQAWGASSHRAQSPVERPAVIWSGEGGSQALGHIHMNETIVDLMRAGNVDAAIDEFFQVENIRIPPRLFAPQLFTVLADVVRDGIREELNDIHCQDAGRNFYLFLMLNEQRRKLVQHFENIDVHRLEFQVPFFDGAFLSAVMATSIDLCLRHKFYTKWLASFSSPVSTVPWQAYPGHEPCPVPVPQGLSYQWDEKYQAEERAAQKRNLLARASDLLSAPDFPRKILNKRNLRFAAWVHSSGLRDYEYAIEAARTYHTYWKKCDGELSLPA